MGSGSIAQREVQLGLVVLPAQRLYGTSAPCSAKELLEEVTEATRIALRTAEVAKASEVEPSEATTGKAAIDGLPCEKPDKAVTEGCKISVRAVPGFDASAVCRKFGGGGHACASGATVYGEAQVQELLRDVDALVKEYKRLQVNVQMRMLAGQGMDDDDGRRFQQLGALLFADQRTSAYLLSEMRLQKMMGEVFEKITRAAGMEMPMPV